jgi:hypothetical protein
MISELISRCQRSFSAVVKSIFLLIVMNFGCGLSARQVEIKEACLQAPGSLVKVRGHLALPPQLSSIQRIRRGELRETGLQLLLTSGSENTGDAVMATFWNGQLGENTIQPLPAAGYSANDLQIFSRDGKKAGNGEAVIVEGKTVSTNGGCYIDVEKVEVP